MTQRQTKRTSELVDNKKRRTHKVVVKTRHLKLSGSEITAPQDSKNIVAFLGIRYATSLGGNSTLINCHS